MNKEAFIKGLQKATPYILAASSTAAVIGSNVMSAKAGAEIFDKAKRQQYEFMDSKEKGRFIFKEVVPRAAIPAATAGAGVLMTWALLIFEERKAAALAAVLAGTDAILKAREKAEQPEDFVDILAKEKPLEGIDIFDTGTGDKLYFEPYSHSWFLASDEYVIKCEYALNRIVRLRSYATLSEFLDLIGLSKRTNKYTDSIGWSDYAEGAYGYAWVDFDHNERKIGDRTYISIDYPFGPHWDYMDPYHNA